MDGHEGSKGVYNHVMSFSAMPVLSPGSRLGVVAPSGPFDREKFEKGLAVLAGRYRVEVAPEAGERSSEGDRCRGYATSSPWRYAAVLP